MTQKTITHGALYIVAAPSGAGKTSLVRAALEAMPGLALSVSHTTRPARPGEQDGVHYHFVAHTAFAALRAQGAFLESAEVFGNYYGTARHTVQTLLDSGRDVILEIDWQGARQVRAAFPSAIGIFILPPSRTTLASRLTARAQDSLQVIAGRMRAAVQEMSHYAEFDYLIVNDEFDTALAELLCLFRTERLRCARQAARRDALITALLAEDPGVR